MKVLAVNSSPRNSTHSTTKLLLTHLVEGMRDAGAEVDIVLLSEKNIRPCLGCFSCWTKTPGQCLQMDDMTRDLLPALVGSDLVVYATPLYYHTMNAGMSIFRERMLPLSQPFSKKHKGRDLFLMRQKMAPVVWVSACGFPELSEFEAFSTFLKTTCHPETPIMAEIYRTSSEALKHPALKEKRKDILAATIQAGKELIQLGEILPETQNRIQQPLMDKESLAIIGSLTWKTCIDAKIGLQEFFDEGMMPRPDSMETFMAVLSHRLDPLVAGDGESVILQFKFSGKISGACFFTLEKGGVDAAVGLSDTYDVLIDTPFALWVDIMTGKADGREMFMQHKYQVEGDLALMLQLFQRKAYA